MKTAEKKTGQKLSPDRRDNSKGYAASNTRAVPEKLNVGRHKVDSKKLSNWRKKMSKSELSIEDLRLYMIDKAYDQDNDLLAKTLEDMTDERLFMIMSEGEI